MGRLGRGKTGTTVPLPSSVPSVSVSDSVSGQWQCHWSLVSDSVEPTTISGDCRPKPVVLSSSLSGSTAVEVCCTSTSYPCLKLGKRYWKRAYNSARWGGNWIGFGGRKFREPAIHQPREGAGKVDDGSVHVYTALCRGPTPQPSASCHIPHLSPPRIAQLAQHY